MIRGKLWNINDDTALAKIDETAMRLLTKGGARIESSDLLDKAEAAGCRIDRSSMRCYFSEKLVRTVLERKGGYAHGDVEIASGWDPQWCMVMNGSHPHYLDWPSGERRLATRSDIINVAKMGHMLDEITVVGKSLNCGEIDQRIEPLWTNLQIASITNKPQGMGEVFFADYLDDLVRMGEVISGKKGDTSLIASCDFFIQPLILERNQAGCFIKKREIGMICCPGTMTVAGMSGPVTTAGVVAISIAELIAGWVLGWLINSDLPVGGIVATGVLDMRTTSACFGSPEALLQNVSTANAVQRLYGIEVWPIVNYTDCKVPGMQAAFNKMLALLTVPFGPNRWIGTDGLLSAGQDYSPVQHILDNEMFKAINRFWGHFDVNEDTLAEDIILDMMKKTSVNFLETEHTLLHYQAEQWYPRWLDRTPWRGTDREKNEEHEMLGRIARYCNDAIAAYKPPSIDPSRIAELKSIFLAAEKRILGTNATPL